MELTHDDPLAVAAVAAIHAGDVTGLTDLLVAHPVLATATLRDGVEGRTLLHVVTDWPGHVPSGAALVGALVAAGADVNARFVGHHTETPLHWAASSDDIEVLDALIDLGADLEADGGVIGGGTPLDDAAAFRQWAAAHRLVERGARPELWVAASLGLIHQVRDAYASGSPDATQPFWCACHGGQPETAAFLLDRGADINWVGYDDLTPVEAAERAGATELVAWLRARGAVPASDLA